MKKRIPIIAVATVLLLLSFILIMTRIDSPEDVLAPPSPIGESRKLQQAFEKSVGSSKEYKLQYPEEGDYRSAYVLYDVDDDGDDEAMVFYKKTSDESTVRVNLLDVIDGEWVSVLDETGYGNTIDAVTFADLNNDHYSEVIFSWSLSGTSGSRTMTVHSLEFTDNSAEIVTLSNMPYLAMNVYDMDNDGSQEILVLWSETTKKVQRNYAALMKLNSKGLRQYGDEVILDGTASVYDGVYLQEGKTPMVFVDALKNDNTMFTEVLWWDGVNQTLRAPFTNNSTHTNLATARPSGIPVTDIDDDGILEIPVTFGSNTEGTLASKTNEDTEEVLNLIGWYATGTAEPGVLKAKSYSLVDTENRYRLNIDSPYRYSFLFYRNNKTGVITAYTATDEGRGEPLFSLVYSAKGKTRDDYSFIAQQGDRTVSGTLTSAGTESGVTNETIQDNIVFY